MMEDLERRHFMRIGGQFADRQHVLLRVGGKDVAAELLDQSSSGFSVQIPRAKLRLSVGKRLLLGTRSTWHTVEVVNLEKKKKEQRAGLQIIAESATPRESNTWVWIGLAATLLLASAIIYQNEDPRAGSLHRCLQQLGLNLPG